MACRGFLSSRRGTGTERRVSARASWPRSVRGSSGLSCAPEHYGNETFFLHPRATAGDSSRASFLFLFFISDRVPTYTTHFITHVYVMYTHGYTPTVLLTAMYRIIIKKIKIKQQQKTIIKRTYARDRRRYNTTARYSAQSRWHFVRRFHRPILYFYKIYRVRPHYVQHAWYYFYTSAQTFGSRFMARETFIFTIIPPTDRARLCTRDRSPDTRRRVNESRFRRKFFDFFYSSSRFKRVPARPWRRHRKPSRTTSARTTIADQTKALLFLTHALKICTHSTRSSHYQGRISGRGD